MRKRMHEYHERKGGEIEKSGSLPSLRKPLIAVCSAGLDDWTLRKRIVSFIPRRGGVQNDSGEYTIDEQGRTMERSGHRGANAGNRDARDMRPSARLKRWLKLRACAKSRSRMRRSMDAQAGPRPGSRAVFGPGRAELCSDRDPIETK